MIEKLKAGSNNSLTEEQVNGSFMNLMPLVCEDYDPVAEVHFGRSTADAPEIDGKVYFRADTRIAPGSFVKVKVRKVIDYDLYGFLVTAKN